MNNPLLTRHLAGSIRRPRFFVLLTLYLMAGLIVILLFSSVLLTSSYSSYISMQEIFNQGRSLYWITTFLLLLAVMIFPPQSALGAIAGEHERRTFDLLRTTTLKSSEWIMGKMASALLTGTLYLFAPLPFVILSFWLGGISFVELAITYWLLFLSMVLNMSLAMAISATCRKTSTANTIFYGLNFASLPLIGLGSALVSFFNNVWTTTTVTPLPYWLEGFVENIWVPLSGIHPLTATIVSETINQTQNSIFLITLPVSHHDKGLWGLPVDATITMPTPWIFFSVFALIMILLLLRYAVVEISTLPRR